MLRIGTDVLSGGRGVYCLSGVADAGATRGEFFQLSSCMKPTDKQHVFEVYLGGHEQYQARTYKAFVSVSVEQGYEQSTLVTVCGTAGDFRERLQVCSTGRKPFSTMRMLFSQEWQVPRNGADALRHPFPLSTHQWPACHLLPGLTVAPSPSLGNTHRSVNLLPKLYAH
jgi:hypothetical protein